MLKPVHDVEHMDGNRRGEHMDTEDNDENCGGMTRTRYSSWGRQFKTILRLREDRTCL